MTKEKQQHEDASMRQWEESNLDFSIEQNIKPNYCCPLKKRKYKKVG